MKYKIGDRVKMTARRNGDRGRIGLFGTVIGSYITNGTNHFCVEFDEYIEGHDGNGSNGVSGTRGYCWWYYVGCGSEFDIIRNTRKIVITSDGTETLARLYDGNKVIKTATAKCSPDDTFDFEVGAKIAFDRLIESPLTKALRNVGEAAKVCAEALKKSVASVEKEPHKYKAGDKVKVIANSCCHGMRIGEVVTLDRVFEGNVYNTPWLVEEYKNRWYIRERDFEPYTEPEKKPLKIEVGKKYLLKPYDEVKEHIGLSKETWDKIAKRYVVVAESVSNTVCGDTCYHGRWAFVPEAFEKEYIEEKPFKFEVGKQYKHDDLVIEITNADRETRRYHYKVIKGSDNGYINFFDENSIFGRGLTPYEPPKYYNGKVVCVKTDYSWWTVGKVYNVVDGILIANDGDKFPKGNRTPYRDANDIRHAGNDGNGDKRHNPANEFVPVVEGG